MFLDHVKRIEKTYSKQSIPIVLAMGCALLGMGKRSKKLNTAALRVAKKIGPIVFDPTGKCAPWDVAKHLSNDPIRNRLGR